MPLSDQPIAVEGVKTEAWDRKATDEFVKGHIEFGVEALVRYSPARSAGRRAAMIDP